MLVKEGVGIMTALIVLAGIAFAIANGGQTVAVVDAAGGSFAGLIRAATGGSYKAA